MEVLFYKRKPENFDIGGLREHPDYTAIGNMDKAGELEKHVGKYLAFIDGHHLLTGADSKDLIRELDELHLGKDRSIYYVPQPVSTIMASPT